jgi:hypothetical protein
LITNYLIRSYIKVYRLNFVNLIMLVRIGYFDVFVISALILLETGRLGRIYELVSVVDNYYFKI